MVNVTEAKEHELQGELLSDAEVVMSSGILLCRC